MARLHRLPLPALLILSDAGWMTCWSSFLGLQLKLRNDQPVIPIWLIALTLAGGVALPDLIRRWSDRTRARRIVPVVAAFVAALVAAGWLALTNAGLADVPWPAVLPFLLTLAVWWRGTTLGRYEYEVETFENAFKLGIAAILLVLIVSPTPGFGRGIGPAIVLFVVASLFGLALARIEEASAAERRAGGSALRIDTRWLVMLGGVVGVLLIVAVLGASVVSFDVLDAVGRIIFAPIELILTVLIYAIAYPLGFLAEILINLIRSLMQPHQQQQQQQAQDPLKELRQQLQQSQGLPPDLLAAAHWIAGGIAVAVILFLIFRASDWLDKSGSDEGVVEERDFVTPWDQWRNVLRRIWQALLARLRPRGRIKSPIGTAESRAAEPPALRNLRDVYRELLRLGTHYGRPRLRSETPLEYEKGLDVVLIGATDPIRDLTDRYVRARYGGETVDEDDLRLAREELARIKRALNRGNEDGSTDERKA